LGSSNRRRGCLNGLDFGSTLSVCSTSSLGTLGDEGMTCGPSIFAYLVFGPGRASTKGITRPTKIAAWSSPGTKLDVQDKDSKSPNWIRFRLGFIQTDYICTLLGGQS
jgi:hypothetical protein